jgi:hypothetical protein
MFMQKKRLSIVESIMWLLMGFLSSVYFLELIISFAILLPSKRGLGRIIIQQTITLFWKIQLRLIRFSPSGSYVLAQIWVFD